MLVKKQEKRTDSNEIKNLVPQIIEMKENIEITMNVIYNIN
jgi:hypothetical protein